MTNTNQTTPTLPAAYVEKLRTHLQAIYSPTEAAETLDRLVVILEQFRSAHPALAASATGDRVSETDVVLITYGDQVQEPGKVPLESLREVLETHAGDVLTGVHFLPFFPYTSDDGFSVVDYLQIDPPLGTWDDVERFRSKFRLMLDAVINHISASSDWFQGFLQDDPRYVDYFIVVDPSTDLSQVTRPRTLPLLTPFETPSGVKHVWTTFSADQIDLNYANPDVLLAMTDVLLQYVAYGAQIIRMDAIAYLWKEIGTSCIHLPQTHQVVQLWRAVLDATAPQTLLITETNVPHTENISYFGDGTNEAQLVYQFPLAPLTLHAIGSGDARVLQQWAAGLHAPSSQTTFFNFLASHDGIGVRPTEGILTQGDRQQLGAQVEAHGGYVSYKTNPDGTQSPYELNINYFDALSDPAADEPLAVQVDRFIAAQSILLSLAGVPGIYVHSLFGSRNWRAGVEQTGRYRTINRQKFERTTLEAELVDPNSLRHQVFSRYSALIKARTAEQAFHPNGAQQIIDTNPALFSFLRTAPDGSSRVLCVHNVSGDAQMLSVNVASFGMEPGATLTDLVSGTPYIVDASATLAVKVPPYGALWLRD